LLLDLAQTEAQPEIRLADMRSQSARQVLGILLDDAEQGGGDA
jgi:hypothetical protein